MNNFVRGIILGMGIGLLVAPMRGEELRRMVTERFHEFRGYLPENEQIGRYSSQVGDKVSHSASTLKDYAQQAASNVKQSSQKFGWSGKDTTMQQDQDGIDDKETIRTSGNVNNPSSTPDY
jgi:gas vesicle protein